MRLRPLRFREAQWAAVTTMVTFGPLVTSVAPHLGVHYQMSEEMGSEVLLQFSITVNATKPGELSSPDLAATNYLTGA